MLLLKVMKIILMETLQNSIPIFVTQHFTIFHNFIIAKIPSLMRKMKFQRGKLYCNKQYTHLENPSPKTDILHCLNRERGVKVIPKLFLTYLYLVNLAGTFVTSLKSSDDIYEYVGDIEEVDYYLSHGKCLLARNIRPIFLF